jgi:hypothetical protein
MAQAHRHFNLQATDWFSKGEVHITASQLDLFWPANFRPIPQKDSAWDAHTANETENRQGEVGFLRYSPYGPWLLDCQHGKCHIVSPEYPSTTTLQ